MRRTIFGLAIAAAVATGIAGAAPASAAIKPLKITDAYVTGDEDTSGILEEGDSFNLVFDQSIQVQGPSFGITVIDANGDRVYLGDQYPEIRWSVENLVTYKRNGQASISYDRVLAVSIVDLPESVTGLDLPTTIIEISGVYPARAGAYGEGLVNVSKSADKVIDLE
jgi:hypothetical protein